MKLDVIRNDRPVLVDSFLISAVLTVLALRVYLAAAHYPQVSAGLSSRSVASAALSL